jgi:acetyltransferase-like isoleucine patch superfamily enzyme
MGRFAPIVPGAQIEGDWYPGTIPSNIVVGEECMIDSTFCFKHFFSERDVGLRLGDRVTVWRAALSVEGDGLVEIGDDCYLANASLVCESHIVLGNRVMVSGGATIADSDFHPTAPAARIADTIALAPGGNRRRRPTIAADPVVIEDDVWIGFNAAILKGVRIGRGAVIGPGAVVLGSVEPGDTVMGNPARSVEA